MTGLAELLGQETELVSRLATLLEREHTALTNNDAEALPGIASEKTELIACINRHETDRLKSIGRGNNPVEAMNAWLASQPHDKATATAWATLLEKSRIARDANERNQILVAHLLRRTNEALDVLLGQPKENGGDLYSKAGQAANLAGRRIVDSA